MENENNIAVNEIEEAAETTETIESAETVETVEAAEDAAAASADEPANEPADEPADDGEGSFPFERAADAEEDDEDNSDEIKKKWAEQDKKDKRERSNYELALAGVAFGAGALFLGTGQLAGCLLAIVGFVLSLIARIRGGKSRLPVLGMILNLVTLALNIVLVIAVNSIALAG